MSLSPILSKKGETRMLNLASAKPRMFAEKLSGIVPVSARHDSDAVSFETDLTPTGMMVNAVTIPVANVLLVRFKKSTDM